MDFDHQRDKTFNIADIGRVMSLSRLEEELSKCDVVCANCHRERTHGNERNI